MILLCDALLSYFSGTVAGGQGRCCGTVISFCPRPAGCGGGSRCKPMGGHLTEAASALSQGHLPFPKLMAYFVAAPF